MRKRKRTVSEQTAWYISKHLFTKKGIKEKLMREGYSEPEVDQSIQLFENDGYLNDEYFMKTYLEEKRRSRPRGYWAYKVELERLGIEDGQLEKLRTDYFPFSEEIKDATTLIRKWLQKGEIRKEILINRLTRRGFSFDVAESAWSRFQTEPEEEQS